jgi:hypothetical protein
MIGALILKKVMQDRHASAVESRDAAELMKDWDEDVTLTLMGNPPIVGKAACIEWEQAYFDTMADYHVTSSHVCVEHPAALGATNTVMLEDTMEIERKDGRKQTIHEALSIDLVKGKIVAVRGYVADPDAEEMLLGA